MAEMEFEAGYNKGRLKTEVDYLSVADVETKNAVEKALLANRISYFIKWGRTHLFSSREQTITFSIAISQIELAEKSLENLDENVLKKVKILRKKSERKK